MATILALALAGCAVPEAGPARDVDRAPAFTAEHAARFASLALECVHRDYPNKISHVLAGDADVQPPRLLSPAFYGCYDWHSAVHGHWLLARLSRTFPQAPFAAAARAALQRSLTPANIAGECAYFAGSGRGPFERPYGLAWLLQLDAELRTWNDADAARWAAALQPLVDVTRTRLADWFGKLTHPIRTGEHSQTAFAMGLMLDWARAAADREFEQLLMTRARDYYLGDRGWSFAFEPGGQDFLSPGLAEADLMRRVLSRDEFAVWLGAFLPQLHGDLEAALPPAVVADKSDGKLAHLDGLNLARAWMLEGIANGLAEHDVRRAPILRVADTHRRAGLAAVTGEHYEGGHWLGSFAVYLVTRRGLEHGR
ncbi:MAG: DUF2891 domain-containing protein [Planctomycetes bacterium]|nr:DUF2891 domain-containing protein [Planctomycetota bacterium]